MDDEVHNRIYKSNCERWVQNLEQEQYFINFITRYQWDLSAKTLNQKKNKVKGLTQHTKQIEIYLYERVSK